MNISYIANIHQIVSEYSQFGCRTLVQTINHYMWYSLDFIRLQLNSLRNRFALPSICILMHDFWLGITPSTVLKGLIGQLYILYTAHIHQKVADFSQVDFWTLIQTIYHRHLQ